MNLTIVKTISFTAFLALTSTSALAGFGDLLGGKEEKKESSNMASVEASQEQLVRTFAGSAKDVLSSQAMLLEAFGLKEEAAKAQASADALSSGAVVSEEQLEAATESSENAVSAIEEKLESGEVLSEEGRKTYAKSFVPYTEGLIKLYGMKDQFQPFLEGAKGQISGASFMNISKIKSKLEAGMFIASNAPGYMKSLYSTSEKLITYASNNGIELPEDSTASLGEL